MNTEYCMLKVKEEVISNKMKSLIEKAIVENKGRITFHKTDDDDDYPLTTILSGKKDIYFISVTDVYIDNGGLIYADGIDADTGCCKTEFKIEPEQYSDILYFIACVSGWNGNTQYSQSIKDAINSDIMELACELAEKEMVNGYGKLPEYFANTNGEYTDFYQNIFDPIYDKYYNRIVALADFELR
jgi:hypothetical protein